MRAYLSSQEARLDELADAYDAYPCVPTVQGYAGGKAESEARRILADTEPGGKRYGRLDEPNRGRRTSPWYVPTLEREALAESLRAFIDAPIPQ